MCGVLDFVLRSVAMHTRARARHAKVRRINVFYYSCVLTYGILDWQSHIASTSAFGYYT